MGGIPASALFPAAFSDGKPEWLYSAAEIKKTEARNRKFFLTSEISTGWKYFTEKHEVRLSSEFPADYEKDIGYKYGHGPGKVNSETGEVLEERAKPTGTWLMRAWLVEEERMVALTIDSYPLQQQMQQAVASNDELLMLDSGIANFYFTIFYNEKPVQKALTYTASASLKVLRNDLAYEEAAKPWYPEAYWKGLNPFEGPTQPPDPAKMPAAAIQPDGDEAEIKVRKKREPVW